MNSLAIEVLVHLPLVGSLPLVLKMSLLGFEELVFVELFDSSLFLVGVDVFGLDTDEVMVVVMVSLFVGLDVSVVDATDFLMVESVSPAILVDETVSWVEVTQELLLFPGSLSSCRLCGLRCCSCSRS